MVRKRGGRGKPSSSRSTPSRGKSVISQDLKADEIHETDEKKNKRCINILVVGHTGAGKSLALNRINNLESDRIALEKATQNIAEVTMDESTSGQLLEHAMDKKEGELEEPFGEIKYESERSVFHFLEAPSDFRYAFKLMNKARAADIAILFVSLGNDENEIDEVEKQEQTQMFIFLISTLSIKKVLIAINKIDSLNESQQSYHETIDSLTSGLVRFGFTVGTDIKCLPLSLKNNFNFQNSIRETWWPGPCFTQIIDEFEVSAHTRKTLTKWAYHLSQSIVDLINTDIEIDEKPSVGALWFKRASTLIDLKKYAAAFEAAAKAAELGFFKDPHKFRTVASMMTAGHYYRIKKNFPAATECFILLRDFYAKENKTNVQQIIQDLLEQAWKKWEDPEESKGKRSSVVLSREEDAESDDNEKDETSSPGTQAQEEELSFNNNSPGTQAQEELLSSDIQINQKIKVSSVSNYEINKVDHNFGMYEGMKIVSTGVCLPLSFIPGSPSQLKHFEQLVSLGLDNASVLSIRDEVQIIEDGQFVTLLVVERVKTIVEFFSLELSNFNDTRSDNTIRMWWNAIEVKFMKIYRDVVDTLVYLHSKDYPCGNLFDAEHNAIYINSKRFVRLLPSLDPDVTFASDLQDFVKHMRGMINLPCAGEKLVLSHLNHDISHLLTFMDHRKLEHVPAWWLLDHYMFWTPQERVNFLKNLISLTKMKRIVQFYNILDNVMVKDDAECSWSDQIPPGIFKEIWKVGDPSRPSDVSIVEEDLRKKGWIQVVPYGNNGDIVRYMLAVYHHYNDGAYAPYRTEKLHDVAIEPKLKEIFPKIYKQLMDTMYICAQSNLLTHEDLKKLSRHRWTLN